MGKLNGLMEGRRGKKKRREKRRGEKRREKKAENGEGTRRENKERRWLRDHQIFPHRSQRSKCSRFTKDCQHPLPPSLPPFPPQEFHASIYYFVLLIPAAAAVVVPAVFERDENGLLAMSGLRGDMATAKRPSSASPPVLIAFNRVFASAFALAFAVAGTEKNGVVDEDED